LGWILKIPALPIQFYEFMKKGSFLFILRFSYFFFLFCVLVIFSFYFMVYS